MVLVFKIFFANAFSGQNDAPVFILTGYEFGVRSRVLLKWYLLIDSFPLICGC